MLFILIQKYYQNTNWIPDRWTIHQFTQMFSINGYVSVPAFKYLMNSVIISSVSTVIAITIGMMGGYAFARFNFRGKNSIFLSLMLARAVPGISLSLPLFILFAKLGIINILWSYFSLCSNECAVYDLVN